MEFYHTKNSSNPPRFGREGGIHVADNLESIRGLILNKRFDNAHTYKLIVKDDVLSNPLFFEFDPLQWTAYDIAQLLLAKINNKFAYGIDDSNDWNDEINTDLIHIDNLTTRDAEFLKSIKREREISQSQKEFNRLSDWIKSKGFSCIKYRNFGESDDGPFSYILFDMNDIVDTKLMSEKELTEVYKDWGTGYIDETTDIFDERTGTSFYDNILKHPDEGIKEDNLIGKIVYMTPKQYYDDCADIFTRKNHKVTPDDLIRQRGYDEQSLEEIKEVLDNGRKLFMPYINYSEKQQEGLHRMLVASQLFGWNRVKFPVACFYTADNDRKEREEREKMLRGYRRELSSIVDNSLRYQYDDKTFLDDIKDEIVTSIEYSYSDDKDDLVYKAIPTLDIKVDGDELVITAYEFEHRYWIDNLRLSPSDDDEDNTLDDYYDYLDDDTISDIINSFIK